MMSDSGSISKHTIVIAGIQVYVYGLSQLATLSSSDNLAVLFLAHPRGSSYKHSEEVAQFCLDHYYQQRSNGAESQLPHLIAVTFDLRNHGARQIDTEYNNDWTKGNKAHGPDLATMVQGSSEDMVMVIEYLPAYIPQYFENINPGKYINIVAGVSLGGHVSWRVAGMIPEKIYAIAPIIGSPNLSLLVLDRMGKQLAGTAWDAAALQFKEQDNNQNIPLSYEQVAATVGLTEEQKLRYPKVLYQLLSEKDQLLVNLPRHVKILMQCGADDPLVPPIFTKQWYEERQKTTKDSVELYLQPSTGHEFTVEMKDRGAKWLVEVLRET
jgi:pimeloyl-ACP methyl ester carboxylesterase